MKAAAGIRVVAIAALLAVGIGGVALLVLRQFPPPPLSAGLDSSVAVLDAEGRLLRLTLTADGRYRQWVPLQAIDPQLVEAVLLYEDAWFRHHPGVNPVSLVRGAWSSHVSRRATVGGSTITMQLARLRGGLHTRTARGKLRQIGHALWLELRHPKDEILEAYLNLAPYGGNIEGVAAASRIYFDKPPSALSLPESLTLAVMPQSPTRRGRLAWDGDGGGDSFAGHGLRSARARAFERWSDRHGADEQTRALMELPLRLRSPRALPFLAPHFSDRALVELAVRGERPGERATTLDLRLQQLVEARVARHLHAHAHRGLDNAAVLLVDSRDMAVRALVGSADFHDVAISGQVNASHARRSPGSTLKPFIYALGIDQGVLHPATVLRDVPSAFGAWTPENHDGGFAGPITATQALNRSRNIPAVQVAAGLHRPGLYGFLQQAGVGPLAPEAHYGLALVLGGGEVSMEDLARMYALFNSGGRLRPLRWFPDDPRSLGTAVLSPEAAWTVRDMLRQAPRPGAATASDVSGLPVAWKTGTSWAHRDAWTAGTVGPWVLVVWTGHFDGRPNPALSGVEAAAPLFFDIVDALAAAGADLDDPAPSPPPRLARVEVCLASGDLPNAHCPARGTTWYIPGVSPVRVSRVHRPVNIDLASGRATCAPFDPATMRREVHEFWPSDLARLFALAGLPRRRPPPGAGCEGRLAWQADPPRITSPWRATRYALDTGPQAPGIALAATASADAARLYWFADGAFVGAARPGEAIAWHPAHTGTHALSVVDDLGRADRREVQVER